jgi:hypothetical protein
MDIINNSHIFYSLFFTLMRFKATITSIYRDAKKVHVIDPKTGAVMRDANGRELTTIEKGAAYAKMEMFNEKGEMFAENIIDIDKLESAEADFFSMHLEKEFTVTLE